MYLNLKGLILIHALQCGSQSAILVEESDTSELFLGSGFCH